MGTVEPTAEQMQALAAGEMDTPLVMINLLRFREQAAYPDDFEAEPCSGEQAYGRYAEGALKAVGKVGGRPIWGADVSQLVIGPADEAWDQAFLVYYPSMANFIEMQRDPAYQAILPHRMASLSDSRLIRCAAPDEAPEMFGAPR